jgi:ABC-2 type transport system permease protein
MATVSLVTPHAWFLRGLGDLTGGGVADVLPAVAALLLIALLTGAVALLRLGRVVAP